MIQYFVSDNILLPWNANIFHHIEVCTKGVDEYNRWRSTCKYLALKNQQMPKNQLLNKKGIYFYQLVRFEFSFCQSSKSLYSRISLSLEIDWKLWIIHGLRGFTFFLLFPIWAYLEGYFFSEKITVFLQHSLFFLL